MPRCAAPDTVRGTQVRQSVFESVTDCMIRACANIGRAQNGQCSAPINRQKCVSCVSYTYLYLGTSTSGYRLLIDDAV